jgi:hypothetical protein
MNAHVGNRSFLDVIFSLFSSKSKQQSVALTAPEPPKPYNPFDTIRRIDVHALRAAFANAAHLALPDDAHVFFDKLDTSIMYSDVRHERGELGDLIRAYHQFMNHSCMREWGFGASVSRCRITGELGLDIARNVRKGSTLNKLHAIPQYEFLRTEREIPTALGRSFTDEVNVVEYWVACFIRHDQLNEVNSVRRALLAIDEAL